MCGPALIITQSIVDHGLVEKEMDCVLANITVCAAVRFWSVHIKNVLVPPQGS